MPRSLAVFIQGLYAELVSEPNTLLLNETGIARLEDGREAVNVGPIVAALAFLTEGRGEDRGVNEQGEPLPDLLSLAFDVVKSIILGGSQADYFRRVKAELDARTEGTGQTSLALAKQASTLRKPEPEPELAPPPEPELEPEPAQASSEDPSVELSRTARELRARVQQLEAAAAEILTELDALGTPKQKPIRRRTKKARAESKVKAKAKPKSKLEPTAKGKSKTPPAKQPRKKPAKRRKA
jgi:hypothetical protein